PPYQRHPPQPDVEDREPPEDLPETGQQFLQRPDPRQGRRERGRDQGDQGEGRRAREEEILTVSWGPGRRDSAPSPSPGTADFPHRESSESGAIGVICLAFG